MGGKHTHGIAFPFLSYLLLREGMFVSVPICYLWSIWYSIAFFLGCLFQYHIYICYGITSLSFLGCLFFQYRLLFVTWVDHRYNIALSFVMFVFSIVYRTDLQSTKYIPVTLII